MIEYIKSWNTVGGHLTIFLVTVAVGFPCMCACTIIKEWWVDWQLWKIGKKPITRPEPPSVEEYVQELKAHPEQEIRAPLELWNQLVQYPRPVVASDGKEYWVRCMNNGASGAGSLPQRTFPVRLSPWPMEPTGAQG